MVRTYHKFDCLIIGDGPAAVAALKEAKQYSSNVAMISESGSPNTTSQALVAVKVLLHAAEAYHQRFKMMAVGVHGAENLRPSIPAILQKGRQQLDELMQDAGQELQHLQNDILTGHAKLESPTSIRVDGRLLHAEKIIIAVGASTVIEPYMQFIDRVLTADTVIEQDDLAQRIGVIGLDAVGLELAQTFAMLGIDVVAISPKKLIGGITDPDINAVMVKKLTEQMNLWLDSEINIEQLQDGGLLLTDGIRRKVVDKLLIATPQKPTVGKLGLAKQLKSIGISVAANGIPEYNHYTMQIPGTSLFLAGDVTDERTTLYEAMDEGCRAAAAALDPDYQQRHRMAYLHIAMTEPSVAVIGNSNHRLKYCDHITGAASFDYLAKAKLEQRNYGKLCIYADSKRGTILGAEMAVPDADHLAHLIVLAISQRLTVHQLLKMPFYHPTLTEGIKVALENLKDQLPGR